MSISPGKILLERYLKPLKLSQNRLARAIEVPPRRINEIILGRRGISADTALRLGHYFGNSPQEWLALQADFDLALARRRLGTQLEKLTSAISTAKPRMKATAVSREHGEPAKNRPGHPQPQQPPRRRILR